MTPDPRGLRTRAQRWASRGRYGEAEAAYREALRLAPDDVPARLGLGLCLRRQRRPGDAVEVLREAVRLQPGSASAQAELGGAFFEQAEYTAAAGATFAEVCKVTVFLKNAADREKVNIARREYFGAHRPASTLVEISRLVRDDLLVEIEAIAVLPE